MTYSSSPQYEFDVKDATFYTDTLKGYPALHDDARKILAFICDVCREQAWPRPIVTDFGRTRNDQEAIYYQFELDRLRAVAAGREVEQLAKKLARGRFSWHVIATYDRKFRAFDLRDRVFSDAQKTVILDSVRKQFPTAEVLRHKIQGGEYHFHFSFPARSRPQDWL